MANGWCRLLLLLLLGITCVLARGGGRSSGGYSSSGSSYYSRSYHRRGWGHGGGGGGGLDDIAIYIIIGICVLVLFCCCISCALSGRSDDISRPKGDHEVGRQLSSRPTYGRSRFIEGTCPCYLCGAQVSNYSWDNGSHRRTCAKVNKVKLVLPQPYMVFCPTASCGQKLRLWPAMEGTWYCDSCPPSKKMFPKTNDGNNRLNCFLCDYDLCGECCVVAEKQEKREGHERAFHKMDKNNDGFIDLEEIKAFWEYGDTKKSAMEVMEDLWGMDTNHDGKVSKSEWLNFMGGKVTDKQYRENIEIGKSAMALKNLGMAICFQGHPLRLVPGTGKWRCDVCKVLSEGGESWRCGEDKRQGGGGGGTCEYDCCIHCMAKQGVSPAKEAVPFLAPIQQASLPVEGWTKKYSGVGESRTMYWVNKFSGERVYEDPTKNKKSLEEKNQAARDRMAFAGSSAYTAPPSPPSLPYAASPPSSPRLPYAVSPSLPSAPPPPPPPSSFLLPPSAPPPPSYDESGQQAEARGPPSGQWSGFYLQNGEKNFFTMHLSFSSSSNGVGGQCTDKAGNPGMPGGGVADILGTWEVFGDQQQAVVKFEKHYRGGQSLNYEGLTTVGFKRMMGTHSNGSGSFEMDFVETRSEERDGLGLGLGLDDGVPRHSHDQRSAWVHPAPISKYS